MLPDLESLVITKGELRRLTGISVDNGLRFSKVHKTLIGLLFLIGCIMPLAFSINPILCVGLFLIFTGIFFSKPFELVRLAMFKVKARKKTDNQQLTNLLKDVDRYNEIIKAIDINDQLEEAGNPVWSVNNREQVVEALKITKNDLVRGLKTERILRENKSFITRNPEMFANSLIALSAMQVSDQASEHGRLLDEALQIAVSVQEGIRKLQDQR